MSEDYDIQEIAENIVQRQDGDAVAEIVRNNTDHACEYLGESVWELDEDTYDDEAMVTLFAEMLADVDEHLLGELVDHYYTEEE